jgi:hypothetical protein
LVAKLQDRRQFGKYGHSFECEIIMNHEEIWLEEVCWIQVVPVRYKLPKIVKKVKKFEFKKRSVIS